jgi:hypothetical protein
MKLPSLIRRPGTRAEISTEKTGAATVAAGSLATLALWAVQIMWPGRVPELVPREMVMPAASALILSLVQFRARNRRAEEDRPLRVAKLR